jgi:hypothetical protein
MREMDILADQALFMLGDLHASNGNQAAAMEYLNEALKVPGLSKSAAERMMPILLEAGRNDEAKYLAKTYLKGCC